MLALDRSRINQTADARNQAGIAALNTYTIKAAQEKSNTIHLARENSLPASPVASAVRDFSNRAASSNPANQVAAAGAILRMISIGEKRAA